MVLQEKVPIQNAGLGNDSYQKVAAAFEGFAFPDSGERGGNMYVSKQPLLCEDVILRGTIISSGYHVETTFTEEQRKYIHTAMGYFRGLLTGKAFIADQSQFPSYADRIAHYGNKGYDFSHAMLYGIMDSLYDFYELYPNLMPALDAVFTIAGGEGVAVAINLADHELKKAIVKGTPEEWEAERNVFRSPHFTKSADGNPEVTYEVACLGEAVAKTMLSQAYQSSGSFFRRLESDDIIVSKFFSRDERFEERIQRGVKDLAERAAIYHEGL